MSDQPNPTGTPDPFDGLPPELADMLRSMAAGRLDPAMAKMMEQLGIAQLDPAMLAVAGQQLQAMLRPTADAGPVDVEQATAVARSAAAVDGDPSVLEARRREVAEAARVARLWLDSVTELPAHDVDAVAWSRAEWVEATVPVWGELVTPVATGVADAVGRALRGQLDRLTDAGLPPGATPGGLDPTAIVGAMEPVMRRLSSAMFSLELGQAVGGLAGHVVSGTEVALPLVPARTVAMIPSNIDAFAEGLEVDPAELLIYLTVRESARARLFAGVPWVGPGLLAAVRAYAGDIRIDTDRIESALQDIDPGDPSAMSAIQERLSGNLFSAQPSPAQKAALTRLETLLALVEGWVDVVTDRATRHQLPDAAALGEAVRRRRATGGPTEQAFAHLVGLELRPRRLRDAANLWAALEDRAGQARRDEAWHHPDLAPTAEDLDDILGYVERVTSGGGAPDALDTELEALLDAERGSTGE